MLALCLAAVFSLLSGGLIAALIRRLGPGINLVDIPNPRSSHSVPTPRGGGAGIVLAFLVTGLLLTREYAFLMICAAIAVIGLLSDFFDISSKTRLPLHIIVSFIMAILSFGYSRLFGSWAGVPLVMLAAIFITGTANIYNFMDGINGIAALTSIIAFGLLAVFCVGGGRNDFSMMILAVSIVFSSLGFLRFNMPGAVVFLGDVGSLFLGFVFAAMTVFLSKDIMDFICISSFLFTFYADEAVTMYLRVKDRQDLFVPHRRHLYQILANEANVAHWKVSCAYGICQLGIGLSILVIRRSGILAVISALSLYFAMFVILSVSVRRKFEPVDIAK